jgi:quinoprotein glucose dehydrogenase
LNRLAAAKDAGLETALTTAAQDKAEPLRVAATTIRAKSAKGGSAVAPLRAILASGTTGEKQNAIVTLGGIAGKEADAVIASLVTDLAAGKLAPELLLEVLEAADKRTDAAVSAALDKFKAQRKPDDLLWSWRIALAGGNAANGKKIFLEKVEASCARCHKVGPDGGEVGPVLDGIASKQTREYLLRSLVAPNAEIAPGFESLIVVLKDGRNFAGVAKPVGPDEVVINSPEEVQEGRCGEDSERPVRHARHDDPRPLQARHPRPCGVPRVAEVEEEQYSVISVQWAANPPVPKLNTEN